MPYMQKYLVQYQTSPGGPIQQTEVTGNITAQGAIDHVANMLKGVNVKLLGPPAAVAALNPTPAAATAAAPVISATEQAAINTAVTAAVQEVEKAATAQQ